MKCIEVENNLDAFFDGETSQSNEIETHLEKCVSCHTAFENLSAIHQTIKQNFAVSAPSLLGEKLLSAFENHHLDKRREKVNTKQQTEKIEWFGIPRFAFAAALMLFGLATISAFQIGKMSVGEKIVTMPQLQENKNAKNTESAKNNLTGEEKSAQIKYIEVPVIREKIVKVPIIKEKLVTRTIYVNKYRQNDEKQNFGSNNALSAKSSVGNTGYFTQINLNEFQPVSEFNLKINREVNENEKQ